MGRLKSKTDYENLRNTRILENQARLASLGLQNTISELRSLASSAQSGKTQKRKHTKRAYEATVLRRSDRLKHVTSDSSPPKGLSVRRSDRLKHINSELLTPKVLSLRHSKCLGEKSCELISSKEVQNLNVENESEEENSEKEKRPANAPLLKVKGIELQLSPEASARRCESKGRGTIYDPILGICCHFCRQKKLCGEEDCKRCGLRDPDQPCIGKTDCSACHSANGVLCRACLKVRYGEEMEEVRENKDWMCPHCIEEKGINPYWICNSSFCLKKRNMAPTGLAIYKAREMGYESVAHMLMGRLQRTKQVGK